jgi:uncharacterized protein
VLRYFGSLPVAPFSRCLRCNGVLGPAAKPDVEAALPARTRQHFDTFLACDGCGRVYWKGAHWGRLKATVDAILAEAAEAGHAALELPPSPVVPSQMT